MESEQRLSWEDIDKKIICPMSPSECRIKEGISRYRRQISHSTVLFTSECMPCGAKGAVMRDPDDWPEDK